MFLRDFIFFLYAINKNFDLIEENDTGIPSQYNLKKGDLLMRETIFGLYHAGVYDGKHVIEFTAPLSLSSGYHFTLISSSHLPGVASIKSLKGFIAKKPYSVHRPKKAIPGNFSDMVEEALDYDENYNFFTNNCLHFALDLLGLKPARFPESLCLEVYEDLLNGDIKKEGLEEKDACLAIGNKLEGWKYGALPEKQIKFYLKQIQHAHSYFKPYL
ncbi:uncharacterized protein LOC125244317 [Megalobrama amblycephala]|uniref:uncharacterized protein LOC125244317 n=1 Tax=Megalobrama amblycephala TaxID=75352 RepID=UPI0020142E18|nr:uncharacterized protein LOC125244317 [Megalobrama amblycephala]